MSFNPFCFKSKEFYVGCKANNRLCKSRVHSTIGAPKGMSMQKEIGALRKQNVAFRLKIQAKFNSEKTILNLINVCGFCHWFTQNPQICPTEIISAISDNTKKSIIHSLIHLTNMYF